VSSSEQYDDPIHQVSERPTLWTRVNTAEATPGVITPLHWDFFRAAERGLRASAYDRGIYDESEIELPDAVDDNWTGGFYGRVALNVDALREVYDRVPGTSADEFELNMFGSVRPDAQGNPTTKYHERVLERRGKLFADIPGVVQGLHAEFDLWWRASVTPEALADAEGARSRWLDARDRLEQSMRPHTIASNFAMEGFAGLARVCATVDKLALLTRLTGGYGDTEDDRLSHALWEASRGSRSVDSLLLEYGYQGDAAGDLYSRVWREDPEMIAPMLAALASMGESDGPEHTGRRRLAERLDAEAELLAAVGPGERAEVEALIEETHRFTALRQLGKVTFWRAADVGRAASRTLGGELAARGELDDPEDVFFLVGAELIPSLVPDARERVAYRRARRAEYETVEIPLTWVGSPVAMPLTGARDEGTTTGVAGIGVNPGIVEARARVVRDPVADDPIEPGEILVCHTTDPSWAGYFLIASALVIDVGGPLSHGAIVARELGVPCVINTGSGTTQLRTGDLLRVDGDAGTVEVLERAG
jgi:phosphohistidine swiveling domain-containing protein